MTCTVISSAAQKCALQAKVIMQSLERSKGPSPKWQHLSPQKTQPKRENTHHSDISIFLEDGYKLLLHLHIAVCKATNSFTYTNYSVELQVCITLGNLTLILNSSGDENILSLFDCNWKAVVNILMFKNLFPSQVTAYLPMCTQKLRYQLRE